MPAVPEFHVIRLEAEDTVLGSVTMADLARLRRTQIVADFHCVTTWSAQNLVWTGYLFRDFYEQLLRPRLPALDALEFVEFKGLDGYAVCVKLEDLLGHDVLLADCLGSEPLSIEHGAPVRLVVPALYGYKNVKHLSVVKLRSRYRRSLVERQTRAHPRGRVALEERGRGLPGPVYRVMYRALLPVTLWYYERAAKQRR
jgi:DMSO/TMAO reductase YedYZ molybdopterin-dependent catalytic subunit